MEVDPPKPEATSLDGLIKRTCAGVESYSERVPLLDTKTASAIAMMKRESGATLSELMGAFGWQAHTVRGFVAGALTKKMGIEVESLKPQGGERTYRIATAGET